MKPLLRTLTNGKAETDAHDETGVAHNRIISGRREFADQYMRLARAVRNWQVVAFWALGLLAVVTVAYIHRVSSSRIMPYVVEVDEFGQARAFGPAEEMQAVDTRLMTAQLALFIRNTRTIYPDPQAQMDLLTRAYAYVDLGAEDWLNDYFSAPEHNPRLLGQKLSRRIEIKSIIAIPRSESWKVSWIEVETAVGTGKEERSAWEGYLTVRHDPPSSMDVVIENPLGVYITAINWARVSS